MNHRKIKIKRQNLDRIPNDAEDKEIRTIKDKMGWTYLESKEYYYSNNLNKYM